VDEGNEVINDRGPVEPIQRGRHVSGFGEHDIRDVEGSGVIGHFRRALGRMGWIAHEVADDH
jgi:hypothetical protein